MFQVVQKCLRLEKKLLAPKCEEKAAMLKLMNIKKKLPTNCATLSILLIVKFSVHRDFITSENSGRLEFPTFKSL